MNETKPKIFFMGAGFFAVAVLDALLKSPDYSIAGVVTQPDKAAGRKRVMTPTPVGKYCDMNGILCERMVTVNTEEFSARLKGDGIDLALVVSFGQILRSGVLETPKFGCMNVHASLLPKYRGASPITSALVNGETQTGVTFMRMERGLDTGPIYEKAILPIRENILGEELELELSKLAGARICEVIRRVIFEGAVPIPQPEDGVSLTGKIRKSDGEVKWEEDAASIERKIRAYHKWPSMTFRIPSKGRTIQAKIVKASCTSWSQSGTPGKILAYTNNQMMVCCGKGSLMIQRILPEGKKEMAIADFLHGCPLLVGETLLNGTDESSHETR